MEKITHFLLLLLASLGVTTASAQTTTDSRPGELITNVSQLTEGDYIYLYCPATDITNHYFGGTERTATRGNSNFFKVVKVDDSSFKLQQCTSSSYLAKLSTSSGHNDNNRISLTTDENNIATFTLSVVSSAPSDNKTPSEYVGKAVRLETSVGGASGFYINYGGGTVPNYWTGRGSWSVWLMYKVINSTTLNQAKSDNKYYATIYLPYDAVVAGGTTAYYGTQNGSVVTMTQFTDNKIPANHGALLVSESSSTANFTVNGSTLSAQTEVLQGTNIATTITETDKTDYYIFSEKDNVLGFYHPNSTTLKANRAYIRVSSSDPEEALHLSFDNASTGITTAVSAEQGTAKPIYDLTGRQVVKASHGIYIQNGKKIIVK